MGVLNKQIAVSKEAYEKVTYLEMNASLYDAYNDILSNFTETEIDKSYGDEMHQFLKNEKGDIYYFDSFKYVFPRQISEGSEAYVLNSNRERDHFCRVRYNGLSIVAENYDAKGTAEISCYFLTDNTREYIHNDMKGDMGEFLLQVSGNNNAYIEKLELGSKITVKKENGMLVSYDVNGDVVDTVQPQVSNGASFYSQVENNVNYYYLLTKTYPLSQEMNAAQEQVPVK